MCNFDEDLAHPMDGKLVQEGNQDPSLDTNAFRILC